MNGVGAIVRSISLFRASISPWMLPPLARSITGKRVVSMTSPVTTTSDARNSTKLSASLWAAGWYRTSMPSSFMRSALRGVKNASVGHGRRG